MVYVPADQMERVHTFTRHLDACSECQAGLAPTGAGNHLCPEGVRLRDAIVERPQETKPSTLSVELFMALFLAATRDAGVYKKAVARLQAESNKELSHHRRWWDKLKAALKSSRQREEDLKAAIRGLEAVLDTDRRTVAAFMHSFDLTLGDNEGLSAALERTRRSIQDTNKIRTQSLSAEMHKVVSALDTAKTRAEDIHSLLHNWSKQS